MSDNQAGVNINYNNTAAGQYRYIVGNAAELGAWHSANAIRMSGAAWPSWTVTMNLTSGAAVHYKHIRKAAAGNVLWGADPTNSFTPTGHSYDAHRHLALNGHLIFVSE